MTLIQNLLIFSMMFVFYFGLLHRTKEYRISLIVLMLLAIAFAVEKHGLLGVVYIFLAFAGIVVGVWLLFNGVTYFSWKIAAKGTYDEGKKAPVNGSFMCILKNIWGGDCC